jgi:hypothetical protein
VFYYADEKGRYNAQLQPFKLLLCRNYVWINEALTIPLATITATRLSKRGGTICFWDAVAGVNMEFHFTKVAFLRYRQRDVKLLFERIAQLQREALDGVDAQGGVRLSSSPADLIANDPLRLACERCGSEDVQVYQFVVFRFVGIILLAYSYRLSPLRYVLCAKHAGPCALRCCLRSLAGYLGFPGFIAAPWYVLKNLLELRRHKTADFQTVGLAVLLAIILPCSVIAVLIVALVQAVD